MLVFWGMQSTSLLPSLTGTRLVAPDRFLSMGQIKLNCVIMLKWIFDILLWTPSHGSAKVGRPARTYIQKICADTGCSSDDLLEAMDDRGRWRKRVRDIRADGATWWWWWWFKKKLFLHLTVCLTCALMLK